jgi:hypothetical protein
MDGGSTFVGKENASFGSGSVTHSSKKRGSDDHGIRAPRIGFGHVHSSHFAEAYHPRFHVAAPHRRRTFFHARQAVDHPFYRPLTHHWNTMLQPCRGGAEHGW